MGSSDCLEQGFGQSRSKNRVAGRWGEAAGARLLVLLLRPLGSWGAGALCAVGLGMSELVLTDLTAAQPAPRCPDGTRRRACRPCLGPHPTPIAPQLHGYLCPAEANPPRGQALPLPAFLS